MKKGLLSILAALFSSISLSNAQVVNTSFEHWDNITVNSQSIDFPRGWHSSNIGLDMYMQYNINPSTIPVKKVSPGNTGNYALKLEQFIINGDTIPGSIMLNYFDFSSSLMPAAPYNQSPTSFSIYVKANIVPNDTAFIGAQLFRWNGTQREEIAEAVKLLTSSDNSTSFQQHTINFNYSNSNTPDSILFVIMLAHPDHGSSYPSFIGSELIIDDITILGGTQNAPPAAPTSLTFSQRATAVAGVNLSWQDNSNNEDGFIIERSTDGANYTRIDTVAANVANFTDNNVTVGQMYFYKVKAYNNLGSSLYTNTINLVYSPSSISENESSKFYNIYPNPNNGQFTISTNYESTFELMDITGRVINTYKVNGKLDVSENLPAGLYFLSNKENKIINKIIIQ
jgi:hypothetical protein